jgi:prepilin-type N-terminal cleavage/methylation domain-containing protein
MRSNHHPVSIRGNRGFTLVEIAVVILIIGIIAALAFPTILATRSNARGAAFINDLRQARAAFESYALINGVYPADEGPGSIPIGMEDDLKAINWDLPSPIGGRWDWDYGVFGVRAAVSVDGYTESDDRIQKIDARIDDGDLSTGLFRQRSGGVMFIVDE